MEHNVLLKMYVEKISNWLRLAFEQHQELNAHAFPECDF
jgi:hypothetical protein